MGQQQLFLVLLSTVVVGIALVMGITMYNENARAASQSDVSDALMTIAARAQGWYRRPEQIGGGARSFAAIDWAKINFDSATTSGTFQISNRQQESFQVTGISKEDTSWSLAIVVYADSISSAP